MKHILLFLQCWLCLQSALAQIHLGPNQPYPNIQAAAGVIQPGDTVYLHAGSYAGYQAVTNLQGNADQWIVITRYQNDAIDISGGWQFISCAYLQFVNLNFQGNTTHPGRLFSIDNGGSCSTQSKHILVDNCTVSNVSSAAASVAFKFAGVDSFEVRNCFFSEIPACEAMSYNTCHAGLIESNRFENCLSGGHIKGGSSDITLTRNLFLNASQSPWVAYELGGDTGAAFYCPGDSFEVKNLHFYANIIAGGYRGLALSSARDCRVVNNTFYNCGQAPLRFLNTSNFYPALSGNVVENNLFAFGASAYINGSTQPASAASFSHNLYYSLQNEPFNGPYWDSPALDAIKDANPLNFGAATNMFVDGPALDFQLAAGSPAIGAAKFQTEPATDFYGKPFSIGMRSIGAIEVEISSGAHEMERLFDIITTPNPVEDMLYITIVGSITEGVQVLDLFGRVLLDDKTTVADGATRSLLLAGLKPGVYVLCISGSETARSVRVVKL